MNGQGADGLQQLPEERSSDSGVEAEFAMNEFGETVSYSGGITEEAVQSDQSESEDSKDQALPPAIGRYEVKGLLGRGAFGAVYLGHDNDLNRRVAIKAPRTSAKKTSSETVEEEFLREARQLAQLNHPGIVTVYDVGVDEGQCYIISDYLEGPDLNHWMRENRPDWITSVRLVAHIAEALATAHAHDTVHRDVKPANIIVTNRDGQVAPVLVDFGLAVSDGVSGKRGHIVGTPNYMSPEQAVGEGHRIDGRTDIYALGVILYRMICDQLPFKGKNLAELIRKVIDDEPRPPRQFRRDLPKELERICLKAMAKAIPDRYTTAGDMVDELKALLRQQEPADGATPQDSQSKEAARSRDVMRILIAEDHKMTRFKLETDLKKWGHDVTAAEDGEQAWQLFQQKEFSIVITDWEMPNVDGMELVRRIRDTEEGDYVYIIMLTAKSEMQDVVAGMGAGADDFLSKPFHRDELHVRLRAGERITRLNRELNDTNRRLQRSLEAAAEIRDTFLPATQTEVSNIDSAWEHRACVELGGDMLNVVPLDEDHCALYVLDVNGEGVPAALLATRLSRAMSPPSDETSLLVERNDSESGFRILEPSEVAGRLNEQFSTEDEDVEQFFTLAYGVLNTVTREFRYTSAGHPPILHQHGADAPTMLDIAGFPIGLAPKGEQFEQATATLEAGDRLVMYSDGLTDTMNESGEIFGATGLLDKVTELGGLPVDEMISSLVEHLEGWRGTADVNDDVSVLAVQLK